MFHNSIKKLYKNIRLPPKSQIKEARRAEIWRWADSCIYLYISHLSNIIIILIIIWRWADSCISINLTVSPPHCRHHPDTGDQGWKKVYLLSFYWDFTLACIYPLEGANHFRFSSTSAPKTIEYDSRLYSNDFPSLTGWAGRDNE